MSVLKDYLNGKVAVLTDDGSLFVGYLDGFDKSTNLLLTDTEQRILTKDAPGRIRNLGTFIIRGEMILTVGLVDDEQDSAIDWSSLRAEKIGSVRHKE